MIGRMNDRFKFRLLERATFSDLTFASVHAQIFHKYHRNSTLWTTWWYLADRADEKLHRRTTVRMGIRVIQRTTKPPLPATNMHSVPVSASPSPRFRGQACKTRVSFMENEIAEDEGERFISWKKIRPWFTINSYTATLKCWRLLHAIRNLQFFTKLFTFTSKYQCP